MSQTLKIDIFGDLSALFKLEQKAFFWFKRIIFLTRHTKGENWNSIMKAAASTNRLSQKTTTSTHLPFLKSKTNYHLLLVPLIFQNRRETFNNFFKYQGHFILER